MSGDTAQWHTGSDVKRGPSGGGSGVHLVRGVQLGQRQRATLEHGELRRRAVSGVCGSVCDHHWRRLPRQHAPCRVTSTGHVRVHVDDALMRCRSLR